MISLADALGSDVCFWQILLQKSVEGWLAQ
jgi:hypothetical protein